MLVVESVVPGGPAHNQLEPGDVLVCMNKEVTTQFLKLESLLDDNVGQTVELELERGGKLLTVKLTVQDLHLVTPNYFLEVSGAVIHPLSYQQSVLVSIDRHEWYAAPEIYTRDDISGLWIQKQALLDVKKQVVNGVNSRTEECDQDESDRVMKKRRLGEELYVAGNMVADYTLNEPNIDNREDPKSEEDAVVRDLHGLFAEHEIEPTLVMFEVFVPSSCMLDGVHSQHFFGTGVIIHHSENMGLVAVDRNTVAISASDIMLSFAAFPVEIPGEVVFLHPVHNYALVAYDPSALGSAGTFALNYEDNSSEHHQFVRGPVVAEAMFVNREEVPVYPIYRDPVHDFGFFHYDPSAIQFLSYEEIPLTPEAACVGLEIRVVGNDSGEKAASGTKGGSSGSPVIDQQGRAVAMNAGGKSSSASAFFLPLERVVRALKFLQKGRDSIRDKCEVVTVPRGTLQATFLHKGFDESRRLGLQTETEQLVRHASPLSETGMLVVESVVPGGPAHNQLEPGDVLVCMNKEVTTQFLKLESLLDDSVGQTVELELERGVKLLTVKLTVQDLHSVTPNYFLEVSGAVIHPLSYQQARNFRFQCGLVYVSDPGYMLVRAGVPRHAIIKKLAGEEISHLEDFIRVLSTLSRGARVPMEYINYTDRHRRKSVLVSIDRHEWYAAPEIYTRDDISGLWIQKQALLDVKKQVVNGVNSRTEECDQDESDRVMKKRRLGEELYAAGNMVADYTLNEPNIDNREDPRSEEDAVVRDLHGLFAEHEIEPTLVMFEVFVPSSCMLDGVHSQHFFGTGVIIYHSENMGLVAVDRNTVAISASVIMLSFAAFPVEIPGEVVFLHPVHNYALVAYDPSALGSAGTFAVRTAQLLPGSLTMSLGKRRT
ncbi:hypothetical protein SSX86_020102 [Deinandra increscens subsp. villosa]|uniref:PDZ domain-containing protein n=1 Tax=Deinandra increscens subsp. villosa TaxID=3103831 RepID=A0AAP0CZ60_9ASTR